MTHTRDSIIEKFQRVLGDRYDYSEFNYVDYRTPAMIRCKDHDFKFEQTPANHLSGRNSCQYCAKISREVNAKRKWVDYCTKHYGDRFDYSECDDWSLDSDICTIKCNVHGYIKVWKFRHRVHGTCTKCTHESQKGRYDINILSEEDAQKPATLYHVRFIAKSEEDESFEKVGITTTDLKVRFSGISNNGYDIEPIRFLDANLKTCIELEDEIFKEIEDAGLRYRVGKLKTYYRNGWTECFPENSIDISRYFRQ